MTMFIRALGAERLKMRRTLALALTVLAPLSIALLQFAILAERGPGAAFAEEGQSLWEAYVSVTFNWWSLLMLPLFVTLEVALVAHLDHSGDHWKQIYALPVPRGAVYAAKVAIGGFLIGLSNLAMLALALITGWIVLTMHPEAAGDRAIPWRTGLTLAGLVFAGSWLMIALHTWVSMRWKSFVVPSAFGIVMTVAGMVVINSDLGPYYPWVLPAQIMLKWSREGLPVGQLLLGSLGGLLVGLIGGWEVTRRDVL